MREPWVEVVWCRKFGDGGAFALPWRGQTNRARSGVDRAQRERGGVISPLGHRICGEAVTPPRFALRFAACEPILPLQGRMGTCDAAPAFPFGQISLLRLGRIHRRAAGPRILRMPLGCGLRGRLH